jgi:hypothetical protein
MRRVVLMMEERFRVMHIWDVKRPVSDVVAFVKDDISFIEATDVGL